MKIAIIYASHDGHTRKICETLSGHLRNTDIEVDLLDVDSCGENTLSAYDAYVFGSAIRYGKHLKPMVGFLQQHRTLLTAKKTAFFSVNLTARKPNRNTPESSNYIQKFLTKLDWQPDVVDVFAGKLDYPNYRFFDKHIIRFIMWLTKGETDLTVTREYTDWERVKQFAEQLQTVFTKNLREKPLNNVG